MRGACAKMFQFYIRIKYDDAGAPPPVFTFRDGVTSMQFRVHIGVERIKLQCEKTNETLDASNFRYAAVHCIQQKLIAGHIEAINQAYEKNFEKGETIDVPSMNEKRTKTQLVVKNYRYTFTLSKQSSLFAAMQMSVALYGRAWDCSITLKYVE